MNVFTVFAGWGPCGALNTPGENEFYVVATALQLLALGISGLLLILANSRFIGKFNTDKSPKPLYLLLNALAVLIKLSVAYTVLVVIIDFAVGDANLGSYDGDVACDPIDSSIVAQAFSVLTLVLFLSFRQYKKFINSRDKLL